MIMLGDYIYAGHGHNAGHPTCLEWKTGKTVWRHNRGPGTGSAAVVYADGNLYFRFQERSDGPDRAPRRRNIRKKDSSKFPTSSSPVGRIRSSPVASSTCASRMRCTATT